MSFYRFLVLISLSFEGVPYWFRANFAASFGLNYKLKESYFTPDNTNLIPFVASDFFCKEAVAQK